MHLGDTSRVSVVDQQDVPAELVLKELLGLAIDPRLVDVRGRAGLAVGDDRRNGDPDRAIADRVLEVVDDLTDHGRNILWCGLGRGRNPEPIGHHLPGMQVYRSALDAAAADIDTKRWRLFCGFVGHAGEPIDITLFRGVPSDHPGWPFAAGLGLASAPQLTQTPCVQHRIEAEGVGEVEPVEPAVHLNPVANVAAALLHCQRLQPRRIDSRVRVRLQFEKDHRASDIHHRVAVDRMRAEVPNSGDHPPVGTAIDIGVGWTYVAVNQRWSHHALSQVDMQAVPYLCDIGQVTLELPSAVAYGSFQHVMQQLPEGAELQGRVLSYQFREPRDRARELAQPTSGVEVTAEDFSPLAYSSLSEPR